MKNIAILGCSNTEGSELYDKHLFDNYYDFRKDHPYGIIDINQFNEHVKKVMKIYNHDMLKYADDCRKLAWPVKFKKLFVEGVNINDFSLGGSGIDYVQYLYNLNYMGQNARFCKINEIRKRLKRKILESDLLIWQLTNEPRFYYTMKNEALGMFCVGIQNFRMSFNNNPSNIPKWKRDIAVDYYEGIFDEQRYVQEKINFINLIISERKLRKKPTLFITIYTTDLKKHNFKQETGEYVFWSGYENGDIGILGTILEKGIVPREIAFNKFKHPSEESHEAIANYIFNFIKNNGLA